MSGEPDILERLIAAFPQLAATSFEITSPADTSYNCLAWAVGDHARWWWPDPLETSFWPIGVPRQPTIDAFVDAYRTLGFEPCDAGQFEAGREKLAIYAKRGRPTHAARQRLNGDWTSKLGASVDIRHELRGLEGSAYGSLCCFLARVIRPVAE